MSLSRRAMLAPIRPTPTKPILSVIMFSFRFEFLIALELREKRIVQLLLTHGCERPMAGAEDRLIRQCENLRAIVPQGVRVGNGAAPHRPGKHCIPDCRH